jgi:hypothetical protein
MGGFATRPRGRRATPLERAGPLVGGRAAPTFAGRSTLLPCSGPRYIADALTRPVAARLPARRQLALRINVEPCAGPTVDAVLLGYARVSTDDQNPAHQMDAHTRTGVAQDDVFTTTRGAGSQSGPGWQKPTEGGWTPLAPTSTASALLAAEPGERRPAPSRSTRESRPRTSPRPEPLSLSCGPRA